MLASRFDTLVETVGFPKSQLTPDQISKINAYIEAQPEGALLGLKLFPNFDATSDELLPSGMLAMFNPGAKVDPTVIGDNMFQLLAVSKVYGDPKQLTDEYFNSKLGAIKTAVDQVPEQRISGAIRNNKSKELDVWAPELGGPGSFVGVYSKLRDDYRTKDYYIAARGSIPAYVQDLKQSIAGSANPPLYRDLVSADEWKRQIGYGVHAARRNLFRGIANVAEAAGVQIVRTDDMSAVLPNANCAPPEMAVPEWEQTTNAIKSVTYNGKPAVAISYGVVASNECLRLENRQFFVVGNAYDGISIFNLSDHTKIENALALPVDTGRNKAPETISASDISQYKGRLEGVVWEGTGKVHADLHPEAFKPINAAFRETMKQSGWNPEDHVERLIPTAIKIWDHTL